MFDALFEYLVKAYVRAGQPMGHGIYWERQYFHTYVGVQDRYKQRRAESQSGMLMNIVAENWLVADSFLHEGPEGQNGSHVCADSTAVFPWLLRWWSQLRQAGTAGVPNRDKLVACIGAWLAVVERGMRCMDAVSLLVEAPNGYAVRVGMVDGIMEWHALRDFCPGLDELWATARDRTSYDLGALEQSSFVKWVVFIAVVRHEKLGGARFLRSFGNGYRRALVDLGSAVDAFVLHMYLPAYARRRDWPRLPRLCVRTRWQPIDAEEKASAWRRVQEMCGSSHIVATAYTGDAKLDRLFNHGYALLYGEHLQAAFASAKRLALNWDPAAQNGYSWDMCLAYNLDTQTGAVLFPGVGLRTFVFFLSWG